MLGWPRARALASSSRLLAYIRLAKLELNHGFLHKHTNYNKRPAIRTLESLSADATGPPSSSLAELSKDLAGDHFRRLAKRDVRIRLLDDRLHNSGRERRLEPDGELARRRPASGALRRPRRATSGRPGILKLRRLGQRICRAGSRLLGSARMPFIIFHPSSSLIDRRRSVFI